MKKLVSMALVATVALGSINLQAGDGAKKAWAYTKIVYGGCSLLYPFAQLGAKGLPDNFQDENFQTTKNTPYKNIFSNSLFLFLPLGILSIKSGKRDLKKLKKNAQKKKAQKDKMLLV